MFDYTENNLYEVICAKKVPITPTKQIGSYKTAMLDRVEMPLIRFNYQTGINFSRR